MIGTSSRWDHSNHRSPLQAEFSLLGSLIGISQGFEASERFDAPFLALMVEGKERPTRKEWNAASRKRAALADRPQANRQVTLGVAQNWDFANNLIRPGSQVFPRASS